MLTNPVEVIDQVKDLSVKEAFNLYEVICHYARHASSTHEARTLNASAAVVARYMRAKSRQVKTR